MRLCHVLALVRRICFGVVLLLVLWIGGWTSFFGGDCFVVNGDYCGDVDIVEGGVDPS